MNGGQAYVSEDGNGPPGCHVVASQSDSEVHAAILNRVDMYFGP